MLVIFMSVISSSFFVQPSSVGRRSFTTSLSAVCEPLLLTAIPLTEKVLHKRTVDIASRKITKSDDGRGYFSKTELFHCSGEGIIRVRRTTLQLPIDLAVRQLLGRDRLVGPPLLALVEHGLVEVVIVAKVCVGPTQACIMLKHAMYIQHLQCKEGGVWLRVCDDGLLPHELPKRSIEVESILETGNHVHFGEVASVAGKKAVVSERVEHRAWAADCGAYHQLGLQ
jgi:hypothetical protein